LGKTELLKNCDAFDISAARKRDWTPFDQDSKKTIFRHEERHIIQGFRGIDQKKIKNIALQAFIL